MQAQLRPLPPFSPSQHVCRDCLRFLLEKTATISIMEGMCTICAIITCTETPESAIPCLNSLRGQTRRPEHTILLSETKLAPEKRQEFCTEYAAIGLTIPDTNDKAHESCGFSPAFDQLGADFVWILDTSCIATPAALENLLLSPAAAECIRTGLMVSNDTDALLSQPVIIETRKNIFAPWKSILQREDLPNTERIPIRGAWAGALYPRSVFNKIGAPKKQFSLSHTNDEYAWKAKMQGIRFELIKAAVIRHPPFSAQLIHYSIAGRSFFYEPGLTPELRYYKIRNWAWIQHLRKPGKPLIRLAFCGFYIILALNAMLRCGEWHIRDVYTLFRALHNGFYGKLRPYSTRKN